MHTKNHQMSPPVFRHKLIHMLINACSIGVLYGDLVLVNIVNIVRGGTMLKRVGRMSYAIYYG